MARIGEWHEWFNGLVYNPHGFDPLAAEVEQDAEAQAGCLEIG
jgi:hypothetical protein